MNEKRRLTPVKPASGQQAGSNIEQLLIQEYKKQQKFHGSRLPEAVSYPANTILVEEGVRYEDPYAVLILEGEAVEQMTVYTTNEGHQQHTVNKVGPGGVAFVQALFAGYASDAADVTVRATSDVTVVLITNQHLTLLTRSNANLLTEVNFAARRQSQRSLADLQQAYKLRTPFQNYASLLRARDQLHISPEDIFRTLLDSHQKVSRLEERARILEQENSQLKAQHQALRDQLSQVAHQVDQTDASSLQDIERLKKELAEAKAAIVMKAKENYILTTAHEVALAEQTKRANSTHALIGSIFTKIQGLLAITNYPLKALGATTEEIQVMRHFMSKEDDLTTDSSTLDAAFEQVRTTSAKLGVTVPPEDISEAPTVPPASCSAPISTMPYPASEPAPDDPPVSNKPAFTMPSVKKSDDAVQSSRQARQLAGKTGRWMVDPKIQQAMRDSLVKKPPQS